MRVDDRVSMVASGALGVGLTHPADCTAWAVGSTAGLVLVDAGTGLALTDSIAELERDGREPGSLRWLLLTHEHPDHAAGAAAWRSFIGLSVAASPSVAAIVRTADERASGLAAAREAGVYPKDLQPAPCEVDRELADGEVMEVGDLRITALATPGHTTGHLCYLVEAPERRYLLSGDVLFWGGWVAAHARDRASIETYRASLERLAALPFEALLPGHLGFTLREGPSHARRARDASLAAGPGGLAPDIIDVLGLPRLQPVGSTTEAADPP
jgi:glyoxylase-like metal-dependent hydrolase (beta-lactamase superfamily II)